ncbi:MAG: hypothetical protein ABIP61_02850 [Burkholderiaceae bacterium]
MKTSFELLIDRHLAANGEPDFHRRAAAVAQVWAADGRLIDPPLQAAGHDTIAAQTQTPTLLSHYPGHRFVSTRALGAHNGFARYGWQLQDAQGNAAVEGFDFAEIDAVNGKLKSVIGFFGPLPAPTAVA